MAVWQFVKDNFEVILYVILIPIFFISMSIKTLREIKYQQDDDQYIP